MFKTPFAIKTISLCITVILFFSIIPISTSAIETADFTENIKISYFNNLYSGEYLKNSSNSLVTESGLISSLGTTIQWKITPLGNDTYTIQSISDTARYLSASPTTSISTIYFSTLSSSTIPDYYKWYITLADGGGCLVQNVRTEKYLYSSGGTLSSSSTLGVAGSASYRQKVWRIADTSYYGNTSSYERIELPNGYSFKTLYLFSGTSKAPVLFDEYNNVLWGTADNFTFSGYSSSYVYLDSVTGTFTAATTSSTLYSTNIVATHKVTGQTTTFSLVINPRAALVGVTNAGHDHLSALSNIASNITACGYSGADIYTGAFTTENLDTYLNSDTNNIFVSRSHGSITPSAGEQIGTYLLLNDEEDEYPIRYYSYASIASLDLTNMTLIMFIACKTASQGEGGKNLPTIAVNQGAKTAVGFEESIGCATANNWTQNFFDLLQDGLSVNAACVQLAADSVYSGTTMTTYVICGYDYTRIN